MTTPKEFIINKYLSVRLKREETMIYVAEQPFIQCKFLLLNIPITEISTFDEIESIDEAAEKLDEEATKGRSDLSNALKAAYEDTLIV